MLLVLVAEETSLLLMVMVMVTRGCSSIRFLRQLLLAKRITWKSQGGWGDTYYLPPCCCWTLRPCPGCCHWRSCSSRIQSCSGQDSGRDCRNLFRNWIEKEHKWSMPSIRLRTIHPPLPVSVGRLVLELAGWCGAGSCGHRDAWVLTRVDSAPRHAPSVLEAGHAAHSTVEIGVTRRQRGVLGSRSGECGSWKLKRNEYQMKCVQGV